MDAPGKPKSADEATRPEQILDAKTLYKKNCAACHGENGQNGAAISLANPVYLQVAGIDNLRRATREGLKGSMMPGFAKSAGGLLTDEQIDHLVQGMVQDWSKPGLLAGQKTPAYIDSTQGDPIRGQQAFNVFCQRCHGGDVAPTSAREGSQKSAAGTILDPTYLALISDQGLRSLIISGRPERGMPDWRGYMQGTGARPMTDQEISDTVAWIASHRTETPGQPYPTLR
jgi:cytochrome c oxidase cbb3-type subunit 3/ubiquinol-cytochrome c reductase cytochrome c subunit